MFNTIKNVKNTFKDTLEKGDKLTKNEVGDKLSKLSSGIGKKVSDSKILEKLGSFSEKSGVSKLLSKIGPKEQKDNKEQIEKKDSMLKKLKDKIPPGIQSFFKSDFFYFLKYYLYYIIFFSIIFYILLYIENKSENKLVITINKIFFYLVIIFLFIIINDIMESPLEDLGKFILIIIFSLLLVYFLTNIIEKYHEKDGFNKNLKLIFLTISIVYIFTIGIIYLWYRLSKNVVEKGTPEEIKKKR